MCGITGIVRRDGAPADRDLLERMTAVLTHRGPDDGGLYLEGPVGLGHRRLSIIDLSPQGRQPMANEDGTCWLVLNGEIYNHQALRHRLQARGHVFRSRSDTETVLHLYEEEGPSCIRALRGMFALALWDQRRRRLLLARDRLGKKPLFYQDGPDAFRFASAPQALLQDPAVPVEPDLAVLQEVLTFRCVLRGRSAFQGLQKLPPGHLLLLEDGRVRLERYWRLRFTPKHAAAGPELAEALLESLREAVRLRLESDVPLGAFLSGGLDSSLVVALMSEAGGGPVRTFAIGFAEDAFDERPFARVVAQRFGTQHQEAVLRPDAAALLPRLVWHYGEPFADASAIPMFAVAEAARAEVAVALTGDGGDEGFGGYERYAALLMATRLQGVPGMLRRAAAMVGQRFAQAGGPRLLQRAMRWGSGLADAPARRYARWLATGDPETLTSLLTPDAAAALAVPDPLMPLEEIWEAGDAPGPLDRALQTDVEAYLPGDLLTKVDGATMAVGLEARAPFLDHTVIEFAARLPEAFKVQGWQKKILLRRAAAPLLPREILDRPKHGFAVPLDAWLLGPLREMAADLLLSPRATSRGVFRPAAVRHLLEEHGRGARRWGEVLFGLLVIELWYRTFLDGDGVGRRPASAAAVAGATSPARGRQP